MAAFPTVPIRIHYFLIETKIKILTKNYLYNKFFLGTANYSYEFKN